MKNRLLTLSASALLITTHAPWRLRRYFFFFDPIELAMRAYLVRHGEARSKEEDPERRLTERGKEDVKLVAELLSAMGVSVSRIYHSEKARARETAEIISSRIPTGEVVAEDGLSPLDDPSIWASRLNSFNEDVMLVGHLPHLSRLAGLMLGCGEGELLKLEAAGVACLERDGGGWRLLWMVSPGMLRRYR